MSCIGEKYHAYFIGMFLVLFIAINAYGQERYSQKAPYNPFTRIYVKENEIDNGQHNAFADDNGTVRRSCPWVISASVGLHTFRGDYSSIGKFTGTISPQWSIGAGKWLGRWIGVRAEFTKSRTDGYTRFRNAHYGYGQEFFTDEGVFYRKMRTSWIDVGGGVMIDITEIADDQTNSDKRKYRVIGEIGADAVSHLGFEGGVGSDNELAAHALLQYSRMISHDRNLSLDVALRGIFYSTKQDIVDAGASRICCNLGVSLGLTWYIGRNKPSKEKKYTRDFKVERTQSTRTDMNPHAYIPSIVEKNDGRAISFYISYPDQMDEMSIDEMMSYGLMVGGTNEDEDINSHSGLRYLYSHFGKDKGEILVSFSDVYAALRGNSGYISRYSDAATVELLKSAFAKGIITHVDVYKAGEVLRLDDYCTTATVKWLKSNPVLSDASTLIYVDNNFMNTDSDNLINKNRCVKVVLQVVY